MAKDLLHSISEGMSGFSKGQKLIARYIIENYDKAAFMTASKRGNTVGAVSYKHLQPEGDRGIRFCLMQGPEHGAERVEVVFIQCDEDIHKTGFSFIFGNNCYAAF